MCFAAHVETIIESKLPLRFCQSNFVVIVSPERVIRLKK